MKKKQAKFVDELKNEMIKLGILFANKIRYKSIVVVFLSFF